MELQTKKTEPISDEEIIELYWQRDERAIKETDIKYKKFLLSVALNIVRDIRDSEECLNDTYIGAWNSMPPARPGRLQSFLAAIMRRTAVNRFNANKRQKRIVSEFTVSLAELEDVISDSHKEETHELAKIINNFVRSLPDRQMFIFVSRYYFSDPLGKIAKELGCSISTVKREIAEIKSGLKQQLESEGYKI